ncbi:DUF1631 domain-containing protein [Pseudomonas sp. S31]|uniref:DUF1631 domain-containing protein n=1 Tax=Pseudomonas sp. S31 TaxID=1564473 RepID=UPI001912E574|nr:DUF1631 domain-containing protein [Pseudomonas sp. S31]MBK5003214.1 DUF1631 domain-containing protein [Pseudomonas sp. S31]
MHTEGKVVPLAAAIERGVAASGLPLLLLQVRDKAALQLRQGLQALFDNADDSLFEMADKAVDRRDQNLCFEAMRDLRLKRKGIERNVLDGFYGAFARIGQADPSSMPMEIRLERDSGAETMVARVLSRDGLALGQLLQRLQALLERPLAEQRNPLGPAALCGLFIDAGRSLGVGARVRPILLNLFERHVLREMHVIYDDANQLLAAAGVLADLPSLPRRRAEDRRGKARQGVSAVQAEEQGVAAGLAVFQAVQGMLASAAAPQAAATEALSIPTVSSADLLRLLTHLQHQVPATFEPDDFDLARQLGILLLRVGARSGGQRRLCRADEDLVRLVGLLFDYIQADDNLPASLRALIGRLHIPLLKVALLDKSLFGRPSHPARRLLNEMAAAAIGWERNGDGLRDSLHLRVERTVQRLLNDFTDDVGLFAELLDDFLAFSQDERRRHALLEQRTRDAEEGRVRTLQARLQVQRALNARLRGRVLPQVVLQMLVQGWSQVLLLALLKHGEASAAWRGALATLDTLLGSIAAHHDPLARERLLQQLPGLLKALRDGLAGVALDSVLTRDFFLQLQHLHLRACAGPLAEGGDADASLAEVRVEHDIVLVLAEELACAPLRPLDDDDLTQPLRQVQRLRLGAWVEVRDEDEALRCKLVARLDSNDRLVFANRSGLKVREWSVLGLAQALRRDDVRLLDDGLLFERALQAVLGELRQCQTH